MHRCAIVVVALAAGIAPGTPARADRSRLADEIDVVEAGDCEVEVGAERRKPGGAATLRGAGVSLACGVGASTELSLGLARERTGGERTDKIGAEGLTAIVDRMPGAVGWVLAYGFEAERGSGLGWSVTRPFVAIQATRQFGEDWLVEAQLGGLRDRQAQRTSVLWAIGVEYALTQAIELRATVGADNRERPLAEAGLRWLIYENDVDVSLSLSVQRGGGPPRERGVGLSLAIEF